MLITKPKIFQDSKFTVHGSKQSCENFRLHSMFSHFYMYTYISMLSCWTDTDVEVFTRIELWGRSTQFVGHIGTSNVCNESLTLHLTNVKPHSIVVSNILLLSTPIRIQIPVINLISTLTRVTYETAS